MSEHNVFTAMKEIESNVSRVFEAGVAKGGEPTKKEFWDAITNNGERSNYGYAFRYWGAEYIRPTRKIVPTDAGSGANTFALGPKLKKVEADYFDFSQKARGTGNTSGYYYTFYNCNNLEEIEDIGMQADYGYFTAFSCLKLHTIAKIRADEATLFNSAFDYAYELKNVTFEGVIGQNLNIRWSTKLSRTSIQSIISCLSDTSSGKTLSLSKTAVNNAFTDAEWNALADTKKNWTISLL